VPPRTAPHPLAPSLRPEPRNGVFLRSDLLGGCTVILFVVVIGWICARLRLPLWLARCILVVVTIVVGYLLGDAVIPEYNKPWGVWVVTIGISIAPIHIGWSSIADNYRAREWARRWASEAKEREERRDD
jgi:hypothetical protein